MAENENEDKTGANSELRYITLELMKLANKRKVSFKKLAAEFVENAYDLSDMLQAVPYDDEEYQPAPKKGASEPRAQERMPPKEKE